MTDDASEQVLALISKYKGVEQAFKLANKYTNKALREIKNYQLAHIVMICTA